MLAAALPSIGVSHAVVPVASPYRFVDTGADESNDPVISGNGRFVVSYSGSSEVLGTVVVRTDLATGDNVIVSRADNDTIADDAWQASISHDGRYVAWLATEALDPADTNDAEDVYVRDVQAGTTRLVGKQGASSPFSDWPVYEGAISASGRQVAFTTEADVAVTDLNNSYDVYTYDLDTEAIAHISWRPDDVDPDTHGGGESAISSDGRIVTYVGGGLKVVDRDSDADGVFDEPGATTETVVTSDGHAPKITPDGRFVVFWGRNVAGFVLDGVFVFDRSIASMVWATPHLGIGGGSIYNYSISDDGKRVAFVSDINNHTLGDGGATRDLFLRDIDEATTTRFAAPDGSAFHVSLNPQDVVWFASIAGDGLSIAFASRADNIVPGREGGVFLWSPLRTVVSNPASTTRYTLTPLAPAWSAHDPDAIDDYDVQRRTTPLKGAPGLWETWLDNTPATTQVLPTTRGRTYCIRARSRNGTSVGWWSPTRCTAIPLLGSDLTRSSGWRQYQSGGSYGGVVQKTTLAFEVASQKGIVAERVAIVATTCPTCGTVRVAFGNAHRDIRLTSATTKRGQVIDVMAFTTPVTGTLSIITLEAKPVLLEGVGIYQI